MWGMGWRFGIRAFEPYKLCKSLGKQEQNRTKLCCREKYGHIRHGFRAVQGLGLRLLGFQGGADVATSVGP